MSNQRENLHKHHRLRLKSRFLRSGLDGFEPHNILELLLFFSIPQGDTNELAHVLLKTFGSLSGVFSAPYSELVKIKGVGDHTATMIKFIPQLFAAYVKDRTDFESMKTFSVKSIAEMLIPFYITCDTEVVRALYFDCRMNLIKNEVIFNGDVNSANLSYKDIAVVSLTCNLPNIIIAHNHPNGNPMPSMEDLHTTSALRESLGTFNITLVDHLVIAGSRYTSVRELMGREKGKEKQF